MKKKVTIQDIADELGMSRNTVSKAINNSDGLADTTREIILNKALEMGYKHFSYVKTIAEASTAARFSFSADNQIQADWNHPPILKGEFALLTSTFLTQSHFASLMLDKFQREITQMGYTLNTHRVSKEDIENKTLPLTFIPERCSAIICIEMFDREYDEMVCGLGIPVLFVDGPCQMNGYSLPSDQLYMDNTTGIARFVSDMLQRGRCKIGWIGASDYCQSFFERYLAFFSTMMLNDAHVDKRFILHTHDFNELGKKLNELEEMPDVFICANDFIAIDVMRILAERGLTVPEDVMICGFDDAAESRSIVPQLTTVHIHTQIMAFSAMHLLFSRIQEPSLDYRMIRTEADLIYRASTGSDKQ